MRDVEGSLPGFLRRLQPSENDINNGWKDTVNLEDRLRLKQWRKEGAPGLAAAAKPLPPPLSCSRSRAPFSCLGRRSTLPAPLCGLSAGWGS